MANEVMIAKMKKIERAQPPELYELVQFQEQQVNKDGTVTNRYQVMDDKQSPGYLLITFVPETEEIKAAEMNVNFKHFVGLNRSPIQLRLTAANVLKHIKGQ